MLDIEKYVRYREIWGYYLISKSYFKKENAFQFAGFPNFYRIFEFHFGIDLGLRIQV